MKCCLSVEFSMDVQFLTPFIPMGEKSYFNQYCTKKVRRIKKRYKHSTDQTKHSGVGKGSISRKLRDELTDKKQEEEEDKSDNPHSSHYFQ